MSGVDFYVPESLRSELNMSPVFIHFFKPLSGESALQRALSFCSIAQLRSGHLSEAF